VTIQQARYQCDIAGLDVPVQSKVIAGARIIRVSAPPSCRQYRCVTEGLDKTDDAAISIKRRLYRASAGTDEAARGLASPHLFIVGNSDLTRSSRCQTSASFVEQLRTRIPIWKPFKDVEASISHQRRIPDSFGN
jgi:hypothetical protein